MHGVLCGVRSWRNDVHTMTLAATAAVLVLALVLVGQPVEAQTACADTQHTITLQNECGYPIWMANAANVVGGPVIGGRRLRRHLL